MHPRAGVSNLTFCLRYRSDSALNADPALGSLEATAERVRGAWAEKLDRIEIKGASDGDLEIFYTAVAHALQYPNEQFEENRYYSGYDNQVHEGVSYTGYSIWVRGTSCF
jgi:putative alpha-1,2-mannosidase